jgi:hypothetical protein
MYSTTWLSSSSLRSTSQEPGANNDEAFRSEKEVLKKNLSQWTVPYVLPTADDQSPATEPVVIGHSFSDLEESVDVLLYGNGFVIGLIRAYHQGLHLRLRPEDVWLSILSQLKV